MRKSSAHNQLARSKRKTPPTTFTTIVSTIQGPLTMEVVHPDTINQRPVSPIRKTTAATTTTLVIRSKLLTSVKKLYQQSKFLSIFLQIS